MARILLVDDDPDQLEIRKLLLETVGHEVWIAKTAPAAGQVFGECKPELVVMDLRLPHLEDGQELIREVRARSSSVRIIVLSGLASDLSQMPEAGLVDQVLHKPFRSERLLGLISKLALLCLSIAIGAALASTERIFAFRLDRPAEVVAELDMSSPGAGRWKIPTGGLCPTL